MSRRERADIIYYRKPKVLKERKVVVEKKPVSPQMQRQFERSEQAKKIYIEKKVEKQLPSDVVITKIKETPEGYEVTYVPKPTPTPKKEPAWKETTFTGEVYQKGLVPSLSEQFAMKALGWTPERVRRARTFQTAQEEARYRVTPELIVFKRTSAEFQAGLVGIGESWVRPDIPTPVGAGVKKVLGQPTAYETGEVSPWYLLGGLAGTYVEAKAIGYVVGKAFVGLKKVTPEVIKQPLGKATQVVAQKIKVSPFAKVAHKAKLWYIEHKPWISKAKHVSPGEVAPPMFPKEPLSMVKLKAVETAWLMETVPRTSAVTVSKIGLEPTVGVPMKHLIFRAGKVSVGYLRELTYVSPPAEQKGMLPYVTQQQLTRMGVIPYVPKVVSLGKKMTLLPAFGVPALTGVAKTVRREQFELEDATVTLLPLKPEPAITHPKAVTPVVPLKVPSVPSLVTVPKKKKREIVVPKLPQIFGVEQPQISKQIIAPKQVTMQITKQLPRLATITPPPLTTLTTPTAPFLPYVPRGVEDISDIEKGLFGKWFKRKHELISPKALEREFHGKRRRRKKSFFL